MFIIFMVIVTGGLVATAAYFSVVGIASVFAYNYVPALILGTTLEAGKISVAVYLYRYWQVLPQIFRGILLVFLTALMIITSVGIFGYLSQGYQKTAEAQKTIQLELAQLEAQQRKDTDRMAVINAQIQELPQSQVMGRIRLSREFGDELEQIRDRLVVITPKIRDLRLKSLAYESHIGPISYVAKMLEANQDSVVFYAILLLVFVADPLAITLTIATNMLLIRFMGSARYQTMAPQSSTMSSADRMVERIRESALRSQIVEVDPQAPRPRPAPPAARAVPAARAAPVARQAAAVTARPAKSAEPARSAPAAKKAVAKKVTKKVAKKVVSKKTVKKTAKKAVSKKTVKKAAKKAVSKKTVKKTAKKAVSKKTVKKAAKKRAIKKVDKKKTAKKKTAKKKTVKRGRR